MILDVGCGSNFQGDVNCDLYIDDVGHRTGKKHLLGGSVKAPNFVLCDVQRLPFKSDVFDAVVCYHVIEHMAHPFMLFSELVRVSKDKVVVKCPHGFVERMFVHPRNPFHQGYFTKRWLYAACRAVNVRFARCTFTRFSCLPFEFLAVVSLPREITLEVRK